MHVEFWDGLRFVEADEDHDRLFPNHFLLVLHQGEHYILDSSDDALVGQLRYHVQGCHHLQVVFRLQIFLNSRDQQNEDIAVLVDE